MQPDRAAEQSTKIGDAPSFEFSLHMLGNILDKKSSKRFRANAAPDELTGKMSTLGGLFHPSAQIFADIEKHAEFGIPTAQQLFIQILRSTFRAGKKTLQGKARAGTCHENRRIVRSGERMQNQRR